MGIRLAPHPHIWGPVEREHEVRGMLDLTDPDYVWLTPDTGHLCLGGMDPVQVMSDYLPRIAEVHLKDTYAKYRGNNATPTREQHTKASVYHNMGGGGVDFVAVMKLLRDQHYKGWVVLDMDGPREGDDGFEAIGGNLDLAIDDYLAHNAIGNNEQDNIKIAKNFLIELAETDTLYDSIGYYDVKKKPMCYAGGDVNEIGRASCRERV